MAPKGKQPAIAEVKKVQDKKKTIAKAKKPTEPKKQQGKKKAVATAKKIAVKKIENQKGKVVKKSEEVKNPKKDGVKKVKKQAVEEEKKGQNEIEELFNQKYDHQRMLKEVGCDLERFVEIRQTIHQNAEMAF